MRVRTVLLSLMAALCGGVGPVATAADAASREPLVIQEQGSFSVGGTVLRSAGIYEPNNPTAAGQTYHGDHAYAFFQVPAHALGCSGTPSTAAAETSLLSTFRKSVFAATHIFRSLI